MKKLDHLLILFILFFLTVVIFRPYFFKSEIPFPANLLVAFYSPWRHYQWDGYPNGPPNKPIGFDVLRAHYPFRKLSLEQLKNGQWPLWNPYNFSGNVHLATYQAAVFYPLNFLYFIFPLIEAWSILVIIQPLLSGFFMYLFLKEIKLSLKACFFGALTFAFSGWLLGWSEEALVIEHTALWLPLILFAIEKVFQKASSQNLLLLVAATTTSILAGFLQMTIYVLTASFAWVVFRLWQNPKTNSQKIAPLSLAFLFSFLLSSVQILPAIEAYFQSARGGIDAKFLFADYLLKPWHAVTFLSPDFWGNPGYYNYFGPGFYHERIIFVGLPALLLSLFVFFFGQKNKNLGFFKWFTLITLGLGFFPLGWLLYFSHLPLISTMIPAKIFFLSTFGFSVLSAYAIDTYFKRQVKCEDWRVIILVISLIFVVLWGFVFYQKKVEPLREYAQVSFRNLILPTGLFIASLIIIFFPQLKNKIKPFKNLNSNQAKLLSYSGLVILSFLSSFYFAHKFLYFSQRKYVFPEIPVVNKLKEISGVNRIWGYGNAYLEKNLNAYFELYSPEGYDALFPQRYGELLYAQETEGIISSQITRSDAGLKQANETEGILDNRLRSRLLSLLGVKYIIEAKQGEGKDWSTQSRRFPVDFFNLAWEDDQFIIWEYKQALPRAFLVHDYVVETDKQKIADLIFDENFDLSKKIILEEGSRTTIQPCNHLTIDEEAVEITSYNPNQVKIVVDSPCDGFLFLSDNYYPGWKASVDGQEAKILRANFSFRSLELPEGKHQIVFSYEPQIFFWSLTVSLFSLLLFGGWLFLKTPPRWQAESCLSRAKPRGACRRRSHDSSDGGSKSKEIFNSKVWLFKL